MDSSAVQQADCTSSQRRRSGVIDIAIQRNVYFDRLYCYFDANVCIALHVLVGSMQAITFQEKSQTTSCNALHDRKEFLETLANGM
eukprot:4594958-Amphidinium_carterae.1